MLGPLCGVILHKGVGWGSADPCKADVDKGVERNGHVGGGQGARLPVLEAKTCPVPASRMAEGRPEET